MQNGHDVTINSYLPLLEGACPWTAELRVLATNLQGQHLTLHSFIWIALQQNSTSVTPARIYHYLEHGYAHTTSTKERITSQIFFP